MYLRTLIAAAAALLFAVPAGAQTTITRGSELSVDATGDGRLAIDLRGDIWIVPGGGGDARQLTDNLRSAQRPRWSPDGERLVYEAAVDGRRGLWIHELASGATRRIGTDSNVDSHPAWHPDGDRIAYASITPENGFDLWEIDVPTGLRWRITDLPGDETEPAWSADGRDLVYIHRRGERWSLVLRRHSQPDEVLLRSGERLAAPSFRPDGSLITYFRSGVDGISIDMVILAQPRLVRRYAAGERFVMSPVSWPDRHRMIYSANGEIRQRSFDAWRSSPVRFRATIAAPAATAPRERIPLPWLDEPDGQFVIRAARLFDGVNPGYQYARDIVVRGGRIAAILDRVDRADRVPSIVIDMGDLTLLPGFVDADARLPGRLTASHGPDLLAMGITTVVASHPDADRLNELWSGKRVPGPRLLSADRWRVGPLSRPELDVTAAVVGSRSTGLPTGRALATEFRAMQLAGLTPEQTLRAKGVNAAAAMLADPYLGRIAVASVADLVFVDGDPLANIDDALNVVAVVRNGRFYSVSGLFDRAKTAESVE